MKGQKHVKSVLLLLFTTLILCFSVLVSACDSTGRVKRPSIRCLYSDERLSFPLRTKASADGGYSTNFYTDKSIQALADAIINGSDDEGLYTVSYHLNNTALLVAKSVGDFLHYGMLVRYGQHERSQYRFHNMQAMVDVNRQYFYHALSLADR